MHKSPALIGLEWRAVDTSPSGVKAFHGARCQAVRRAGKHVELHRQRRVFIGPRFDRINLRADGNDGQVGGTPRMGFSHQSTGETRTRWAPCHTTSRALS